MAHGQAAQEESCGKNKSTEGKCDITKRVKRNVTSTIQLGMKRNFQTQIPEIEKMKKNRTSGYQLSPLLSQSSMTI